MQRLVEVWRKAEALHAGSRWASTGIHLNHWAITWQTETSGSSVQCNSGWLIQVYQTFDCPHWQLFFILWKSPTVWLPIYFKISFNVKQKKETHTGLKQHECEMTILILAWTIPFNEVWLPPILSITEPNTSPAQVSKTMILLPAWMFPRVKIWANVSYRRWLKQSKNIHNTVYLNFQTH